MINKHDEEYKRVCNKILNEGTKKSDRTGVGTISIFGEQMRFKMSDGFPLLTLRKIHTTSLVHELLWFLEAYDKKYNKFGNTNIRYLLDNKTHFWSDWCYVEYKNYALNKYLENDLKDDKTIRKFKLMSMEEFEEKIKTDDQFALEWGDLGNIYGHSWKNFGGYTEKVEMTKQYEVNRNGVKLVNSEGWKDVKIEGINQIDNVVDQLTNNPDSRRIIVNSWNPIEIEDCLLPPCHFVFQFYTRLLTDKEKKKNKGKERAVSLMFNMRSSDVFLGLPYNIASYALLLHMIAQVVNMVPDELIYTGADVHLYNNSIEAAKEIISRKSFEPCNLVLDPKIKSIYDFRFEHIKIENYQYHPNIKVDVAV